MNVAIRPLSEINQQATDILTREMGVVDALRFLSQFNLGSGDYTKERDQWLSDLTLAEIGLFIVKEKLFTVDCNYLIRLAFYIFQ